MIRKKRGLGLAFRDEVNSVNNLSSKRHGKPKNSDSWQDLFLPNYDSVTSIKPASVWRAILILSLFLIFFGAIFVRLLHLQVVYGDENRQLADSNRVQIRIIHAPRGVIYDRNGVVLAMNNPGFRLKGKFITRDEALKLEAQNDPKANELEVDTIRYYPYSPVTSHILGYVGQITSDELKNQTASDSKIDLSSYRSGDRIGRAGIEQEFEQYLRGRDGADIIEVDAGGHKLQTLRRIEPIPGENIYLSIDIDLEKVTYQALEDGVSKNGSCCGAALVSDPKTGQILAMASIPNYDANAFTDPQRSDEAAGYFADPNSPLLNRSIAGTYPPGSTFKIVSALAGLSSGKITAQTEFEDTGVMSLGPYQFANWYFSEYGRKEGPVDIIKAIQRSNDIYFYQVGNLVGEKVLGDTAKKLEFGQKVGIDIPGEVSGLIPDDNWKEKNIGTVWYPGDTLHMAIGQGYVLTTPLQILDETNFMAEDGVLYKPYLVTKITNSSNAAVSSFNPTLLVKNIFSKDIINLVKIGLAKVPQNGGTAWPFFSFSIPTSGKTGTAEFGDPKNRTHAWYTSFAPSNNPQISATVLVEAAGEGSNVSAPVIKQIYTWYFNPDKTHIKSLDVYPIATASARTLGE